MTTIVTLYAYAYLPGLACCIPARDENMSGAPFPSAKMVTPATFWESLSVLEMTARLGQKKSSAAMANAMKRLKSHTRERVIAAGCEEEKLQ